MVTVIAEAGVNHNGDPGLARALVDAAADAGADMVKFQTFKATALAAKSAPKAAYQKATSGAEESQLDMLRALELAPEAHRVLIDHCAARGIDFLSTPFDFDSLALLAVELDLPVLKVGSGDMTNAPLLHACARTGKPIILSTGMATMDEVRTALGVAAHGYLGGAEPGRAAFEAALASEAGRRVLADKLTLLHCTTSYPTPPADINLRAMDSLRDAFGLPVGLSDHSTGIAVAIAAAARGAVTIEKHITLDRTLPGPDHAASLEPDGFTAMVAGIREVEAALGDGIKQPTADELGNRTAARKSLVAARDIARDERFTEDNLTLKRPGNGVSTLLYWDLLGRKASRAYAADDTIAETP